MLLALLLLTISIAAAQSTVPDEPPTQSQRLRWAAFTTIGPTNLLGGAITSAISTGQNRPPEYGVSWKGYGERMGLRLSGAATSNLMETELGALWGEDPRYRRMKQGPFKSRLWNVVKMSVEAYDAHGRTRPAYARFIAIPASNIVANTWRPDSQHTVTETGTRIGLGFVSRVASNTFVEFWPDLRRLIRR